MGTWTRSPFAIRWVVRVRGIDAGWYEVQGWVRDLWGIDNRDGWWTVTHLPTGYRLYETIWRRSALQFVRLAEGLTDWGAITVEDEKDPLLVETVVELRGRASIWPGKVMQLDTEYDEALYVE